MRPDPGRDLLEARLSSMTPDERALLAAELRDRGMRLVWDQLDRSGLTDPVDRALFLVSRCYPEMPPAHVDQVRAAFQAAYERGDWTGPERPVNPRGR